MARSSSRGKGASPIVSAQVLLRPASGRRIGGRDEITSENIRDYAPPAEAAALARETFEADGFDVGPLVGISFSIAAPVSTFERVFEASIAVEAGRVSVTRGKGSSLELPLDALPEPLRNVIEAVTFERPLDFGPGAY
jgi:hypothetical protein